MYLPYAAVCQDASALGIEASRWLTRSLAGVTSGACVPLETTFEINATTGLPSPNSTDPAGWHLRLPVTPNRARNRKCVSIAGGKPASGSFRRQVCLRLLKHFASAGPIHSIFSFNPFSTIPPLDRTFA